jgi:hypothetical protein
VSVDPDMVRALYGAGMTQREIADELGVYRSAIHRVMCRYKIPRRPAIKRDQTGPRNAGWKGARASYNSLHKRVIVARGKATSCSECGCTDPAKRYDWANLTGRYEDVEDYRPMCRSCHQRYDGARRRELGQHRWRSKAA